MAKIQDIEQILKLRDEASKVLENYRKNAKVTGTDVEKVMELASRAVNRHGKSTDGLTKYVRESQREQRQQNFLFRQGQEVVGAASIALALFSNTGGRVNASMRKVSDSLNDGFLAFQGMGNALSFLPGPAGQVIAAVAGVTVAVGRLTAEAQVNFEHMNKMGDQIEDLLVKLGRLPKEAKFATLTADVILAQAALKRLQGIEVDWVKSLAAQAAHPGAPLVYKVIGTPEMFQEAKKNLLEAEVVLEDFTKSFSEGNTSKAKEISDIESEIRLKGFTGTLDKELAEIDQWYAKVVERAKGNDKLVASAKAVADAEKEKLIAKAKDAADAGEHGAIFLKFGVRPEDIQRSLFEADQVIKQFKSETISIFGGDDPAAAQKAGEQAALLAELRLKEFTSEKEKELFLIDEWYAKSFEKAHGNAELETRLTEVTEQEKIKIRLKHTQQAFRQIAQIAQQAMSVIGGFQKNQADAEMQRIETERNARLRVIDEKLKAENLTESQKVELLAQRAKLESEYDAKARDAKTRAFKAEKDAARIQAIIQTAVAIMEASPNPFLMAAMAALGTAQVAIIEGQPTPAFHQGGSFFVNAPPSQEFPILVRGGERGVIQTEDQQQSGRGVTVVININAPGTPIDMIKRAVEEGLQKTGLTVDKFFRATNSQEVRLSS